MSRHDTNQTYEHELPPLTETDALTMLFDASNSSTSGNFSTICICFKRNNLILIL